MSCCATCCCFCCSSFKGASFFCTSIHIFLGLYLTIKWIVVTFVNGLADDYFEDTRMRVIYPILLIYLGIFLVLGFINFLAVDRESIGILRWSMRAFLLLQISMLLTNTLLAFAFPEWENDLAVHRVYHVKYMIINVLATSIYFYAVWRFVFTLEHGIYEVHKKRKKMSSSISSAVAHHHADRVSSTDSSARPSAPWSASPSASSRLHRNQLHEEEEHTLPLKSASPSSLSEPQPCSSKS